MPRRRSRRPVRYAVVGLGHIAQVAVLPAFRNTPNCTLAALVSGDPAKRTTLARRYRVKRTSDYGGYDELLRSGDVDAVYIALPNDLHRDFAVRAAKAGVHILCEKPLAVTEADCRAMIQAARAHGVLLMTAYRLHFDPANLDAIERIRSGELGDPRVFNATFTMQVADENIRVRKERGGGPLYDIGVYCINAARYLFGDEPTEVVAVADGRKEKRFREVPESVSATMRFPRARLASFVTSFGAAGRGRYEVVGTRGSLDLDPAFHYAGNLTEHLSGTRGSRRRSFARHDQFAAELAYFSRCIREGREPEPSGQEGLADVRIIRAMMRSIDAGRPVKVSNGRRRRRPTAALRIERPPIREPGVYRARAPSGD
jgi:glucose-fructose oxidoreductase